MNAKNKRYLSPLPNLIAHKANIGIYHYFLTKYKSKFTTYFGKEIFERYVEKTLNNCCYGFELKNEESIKLDHSIPSGVKIPDFLLINKDKGIIMECKAAVLPLKVYAHGSMNDFVTTVKKIYTGVSRVTNFEEYALKNSFYDVKEWIGVIVSYEPLWGINSGIFSDILLEDFIQEKKGENLKVKFEKIILLSISELDTIQPYVSEKCSLYNLLERIKADSFNEVINDLIEKSGITFKNSHLAKYIDQITLGLGLDRTH